MIFTNYFNCLNSIGEKMMFKILAVILIFLFLFTGCDSEKSQIESGTEVNKTTSTEAVPVEAMLIKETKLEQKLPLTGVLLPNNSVDIVAEVSGKVISVNKELGEYINANSTLAIIDYTVPESQFKQAEAQVLSTENNLKIVKSNLKSDKILFENGDISELEYENSQLTVNNAEAQYLSALAALSAAKKSFEDTRIKSPISGIVSRKNIEFGTMVAMGTTVYRVVDLSVLKIRVSIPQEMINRVKINDKAIVKISALEGRSFDGIVKRISPQADESTGGFMVEIHVVNKDNVIKAGMTAKIDLILSKNENTLAIPEYALVNKNDENYVYRINGDFAELTKIDIGESYGENIVVKNGLKINDKIVTVGMKNLGTKTKVTIEQLN
jgi:RND family efflux transporter MFP subunit